MCCSHHSRHPKSQGNPFTKIALIAVSSLTIVVASYGYWNNTQTVKAASPKYSSADVVYIKPLRTEHMMGSMLEQKVPIPFLPKGKPQPSLTLSPKTYDFGSIGPKDIVKQTFLLRNTGKGQLTISRAYTTCGCTTAEFTSTIIPPGKVSLVTVTVDAGFHDTRGQTVRRGVIIENNDPNQPKVELWVKADVRKN